MSHLTREKLEALSRCWEQWEAEAATPQRKVARARLHLLFLLLRYGGLRLGEALELDARKDVDTVTGMVHVPGPNSRDVLLPLSAMRHVRRILSLPEAESMGRDFLHFDQGFIRKSFYAVAQPLGLDRAMVGPRAIRYARGLELLDLHVPVNLVQKFLGQQKPSQIAAFLNFSDGAARRMVQNKTLGPSSGTDPLCNSFLGIVEDISVGMRMASVSVRTFGDMRLGVQCSTRQFVHMEIHANQVVTVLVDPEQIVLSRSRATLSMGNWPALHGAEHPPGPGGVLRLAGTGRRLAPVRHGGDAGPAPGGHLRGPEGLRPFPVTGRAPVSGLIFPARGRRSEPAAHHQPIKESHHEKPEETVPARAGRRFPGRSGPGCRHADDGHHHQHPGYRPAGVPGPTFQKETGIELKWVAVGTGKALEIAKNCDADVLLVHAPAAEKEFVKAGHGIDRRQVMYNDFVVVGPKADPAGVKGKDTAAALKTIADKKASFVSRGDQSGTHKAELKLWKQSGLNPDKEAFYISAGQGMMATLNMAAEKSAYTLTDRGTWIKFNAQQGAKNPLAIVVEGDKALFNQYSVITVNPKQCPKTKADLGKKFEDWWVAPSTQKRIAEFKLEGKQLFFPNAGK